MFPSSPTWPTWSVQSSTITTNGFPANEVGGILTLFLPVAASLVMARSRVQWLAVPVFLLVGMAIVLTHSRAAAAGALLALLPLVLLLHKRVALAVVLTLVTLTGAVTVLFGRQSLALLTTSDGAADLAGNLVGRAELWERALTMMVDMPVTGIGLNTFPVILREFYPTVHHEGWASLPHAHNLFLQTGLDFGLLGLGAFLALIVLAVRGGLAAIRANEHRYLAAGLLLGLLAHGIYSLVDAVALGSKPGPALWAVLGLLIALGIRARAGAVKQAARCPRRASPLWSKSVPVRASVIVVFALALAAPMALNGARLILHGAWASAVGLLDADLTVADALAWGPYRGRVWAARALAARARGDQPEESTALETAFDAAPWDASVGLRLGDLRWERNDWDGAIQAWRAAGASEVLIERGRQAQSLPTALDWFAAAQSVDPLNWTSYSIAATRLETQDPQRAAQLLAEALQVRGSGVAREAVIRRLVQPELPLLSDPIVVAPSPIDADLFSHAARILALRADRDGAFFAAQLAVDANPSGLPPWQDLATLWQAQGRPDLAQQARLEATRLHR